MREFLIDTDTASDDAVAIQMALAAPDVQVLALTTVAGNVGVAQATANALLTVEIMGAATPVFAGAAKPLTRDHEDAHWFHGRDGMGDRSYPAAERAPEDEHAVDALLRLSRQHPGATLVTLGPLTNVALALARDPGFAVRIGRCVVMGGAPCCEGNVTPAAEYNIWVDPEAASMVFRSQLADRDGRLARLARRQRARRRTRSPTSWRSTPPRRVSPSSATRARGRPISSRPASAAFRWPTPRRWRWRSTARIGLSWSRHRVEIECASELTRGMTVVDRLNVSRRRQQRQTLGGDAELAAPSADICWTFDAVGFKAMLKRALADR